MKTVLLSHPVTANSASMPRVTRQLAESLKSRGHDVEIWTSPFCFGRIASKNKTAQKWLGYIDQLVLFPWLLSSRIRRQPMTTLFVVTDQGLGPWVPRVSRRPHVVHCNDLLAIRSAIGEIAENPTRTTGRWFQKLILRGLRTGRNFISISEATRNDLRRLVNPPVDRSHLIHLDLNYAFRRISTQEILQSLGSHMLESDAGGILLHVGGNQWYKNRHGVIKLYLAWCELTKNPLPLWLVGESPDNNLRNAIEDLPKRGHIRFLTGLNDEQVVAAYNLARITLFPSLEEGFGWPIAESMACGTPVLTTDMAPMTEVGGNAAVYHRRWTNGDQAWAIDGAAMIEQVIGLGTEERSKLTERSLKQAEKFSRNLAIEQYESIYQQILADQQPCH